MIERIRIQGFKSLVDVTVDLGPLTVLIGRSGTGKTNFVEAIRFLRNYLIHGNKNFIGSRGGWQSIVSITRPEVGLRYDVRFRITGIEDAFDCRLVFRSQMHRNRWTGSVALQEERLMLGGRDLFHRSEGKWVHPPPVHNPPEPAHLALGTVSGVREISVAHVALTQGIGCYDFPGTVLQPSSAGVAVHQTGLADDGANALAVFNGIRENLQALPDLEGIMKTLRAVNRSVRGVDVRMPERNTITISHAIDSRLLELNVAQESEGLRRFLAHLIALYQSPRKQTLIFEGPEHGIHPGAFTALADEFKLCPEEGRGQVILTTHSPELLNNFKPEEIRVVEIENHQTRIGPVTEEQVESIREQLLQPGDLLTTVNPRIANPETPAGQPTP